TARMGRRYFLEVVLRTRIATQGHEVDPLSPFRFFIAFAPIELQRHSVIAPAGVANFDLRAGKLMRLGHRCVGHPFASFLEVLHPIQLRSEAFAVLPVITGKYDQGLLIIDDTLQVVSFRISPKQMCLERIEKLVDLEANLDIHPAAWLNLVFKRGKL